MGYLNGFLAGSCCPKMLELKFLFIHLLVHFALDLLKIKSHVWSILAFFGGGSKIQVTFPHVRVQITMIQINKRIKSVS